MTQMPQIATPAPTSQPARPAWEQRGPASSAGAGQSSVRYVCPRCHGSLSLAAAAQACQACAKQYALLDTAYADFAGPEISFDDWWVQTPELQRQWLEQKAPREE